MVAQHMTPAQIAEAQKLVAAAGAPTSQDTFQYDKQPIPIGEVRASTSKFIVASMRCLAPQR
jgi:hypothetical protein